MQSNRPPVDLGAGVTPPPQPDSVFSVPAPGPQRMDPDDVAVLDETRSSGSILLVGRDRSGGVGIVFDTCTTMAQGARKAEQIRAWLKEWGAMR